MLTVVMECRDNEAELAQTLSGLVSGAVEGLVSDVVVLDRGSSDGSAQVADAAGCRFYREWTLSDVLKAARGEWILVIEPGARLQKGWIDEVMEYVATGNRPARFSPARHFRPPFLKRMFARRKPLEHGVLLTKRLALEAAGPDMDLTALVAGLKAVTLSSEVIPARFMRSPG